MSRGKTHTPEQRAQIIKLITEHKTMGPTALAHFLNKQGLETGGGSVWSAHSVSNFTRYFSPKAVRPPEKTDNQLAEQIALSLTREIRNLTLTKILESKLPTKNKISLITQVLP